MKIKSGIYEIGNKDKSYIGASRDIKNRLSSHRRKLSKNNHPNKELQEDYNKSPDSFTFETRELVEDVNLLREREDYYIRLFESYEPEHGYNRTRTSGYSPYREVNKEYDKETLLYMLELSEKRNKRLRRAINNKVIEIYDLRDKIRKLKANA